MKPQQLANILGVTSSTLRRWAGKEYTEFLSPSGAGMNGARRSFSDRDARIIAWIALMKSQNMTADDIIQTLRSAQINNWRDLPLMPGGIAGDEPIAVVPREAVEERVHALQARYELELQTIIKERDALKTQLESIRQETEANRRDLEVARRETDSARMQMVEAIRAEQQKAAETAKALQQRITEISTQEAELRGTLNQYTFGGRRFSAVTLVVVALVVGAIIMMITLIVAIRIATK